MPWARAIALAVALSIGAAAGWGSTPSMPKGAGSVVRVLTEDDEGNRIPVCSGFVINQSKRLIMTAAHCVPPNEAARLIYIAAGRLTTVMRSPQGDVAVVRVLGDPLLPPSLPPDPSVRRSSGDTAVAVGWDGGVQFRAMKQTTSFPLILIAGFQVPSVVWYPAVKHGMSGGPYLKDGKVVGVVSFIQEGANLSVTTPMVIIYGMTKDHWEHQPPIDHK